VINVVSPKGFLTQDQFNLIKMTLSKIEDIMCDFALDPSMEHNGQNGMIALALSLTHLAIGPMVEVEREMVEVFFDGLLAETLPIIHDTEQCIRESVSPESLN